MVNPPHSLGPDEALAAVLGALHRQPWLPGLRQALRLCHRGEDALGPARDLANYGINMNMFNNGIYLNYIWDNI